MKSLESYKILIPGIKQFESKNYKLGFIWLIGTLFCYYFYIVPGLIIHGIYIYKYCLVEFKDLFNLNNKNILKAEEVANNQDYLQAISILETIDSNSKSYRQAQTKIIEYRHIYDNYLLESADNLVNEGKYKQAIEILSQIAYDSDHYQQAQLKIVQYKESKNIEDEEIAKQLLSKAISLAEKSNFDLAIESLKRIKKESSIYPEAQNKISLFQEEKELYQANILLQNGIALAEKEEYTQAINTLQQISQQTSIYTEAQEKITIYQKAQKELQGNKFLNKAIALAEKEEYIQAVNTLEQISQETSIYLEAENKILEYQKQIKLIEERIAKEFLEKAKELAQEEKYQEAINILTQISNTTEIYHEVPNNIEKYQKALKAQQEKLRAEELLNKAIDLARQEKYSQAITILEQISPTTEVYDIAQNNLVECQKLQLEKEAKLILEEALNYAERYQYQKAITILNQISNEAKVYSEAQETIEKYKEIIKNQEKSAAESLHQATVLAQQEEYTQAINVLQQISQERSVYNVAQNNLIEYQKLQSEKEAKLKLETAIKLIQEKKYIEAISLLNQISNKTEIYPEVKNKLEECQELIKQQEIEREKQREIEREIQRKAQQEAQARQLVESASKLLFEGEFAKATNVLKEISEDTQVSQEVQEMMLQTQRRLAIKDRAITVERLYIVDKLSSNDSFFAPVTSQGGKLLCLELKVENIGKETGDFMFSTFDITDDEDYKYSSNGFDFDNEMSIKHYAEENGFTSPSDPIRPKGSGRFLFVFDVNQDSKNFTLHWKGQSLKLY